MNTEETDKFQRRSHRSLTQTHKILEGKDVRKRKKERESEEKIRERIGETLRAKTNLLFTQ